MFQWVNMSFSRKTGKEDVNGDYMELFFGTEDNLVENW